MSVWLYSFHRMFIIVHYLHLILSLISIVLWWFIEDFEENSMFFVIVLNYVSGMLSFCWINHFYKQRNHQAKGTRSLINQIFRRGKNIRNARNTVHYKTSIYFLIIKKSCEIFIILSKSLKISVFTEDFLEFSKLFDILN